MILLPGGESNPGLPRDRRGYLPLYYRGAVSCWNTTLRTDHENVNNVLLCCTWMYVLTSTSWRFRVSVSGISGDFCSSSSCHILCGMICCFIHPMLLFLYHTLRMYMYKNYHLSHPGSCLLSDVNHPLYFFIGSQWVLRSTCTNKII